MQDTRLTITVPGSFPVSVLLTVAPVTPVAGGSALVGAVQTVVTDVAVDFGRDLPVCWMAALQCAGDLAANRAAMPYAGTGDRFVLTFGNLAVTHDGDGWHLPHFDSTSYAAWVGFGVTSAVDGLVWAYRVKASPGATVPLDTTGYQLARSNGAAEVGDPFVAGSSGWAVPFGTRCTLSFDDSGVGTLVVD